MIPRLLTLPKNHSCFLFGARGTGKSTLLRHEFSEENTLWIDLLDIDTEDKLARQPSDLKEIVLGLPKKVTHVVIDEIQKLPKLLDLVHLLIESTDKKFILTGSSARKLKHGGANLLAGRAFVYNLYPFSYLELTTQFDQRNALKWGMLPKVYSLSLENEKSQYLQAYANTYLKEEIWNEQLIRKLDPFRRFLEVAAQSNGKIINFTNIARDVGVDTKTVQAYFSILEDTLIGFMLEAFNHSFRKRLSKQPKFYFFDVGATRALSRQLSIDVQPGTNYYGDVFEHFIVLEIHKLIAYYFPEYRMTYLRTKDGAEIDLVIERPGLPLLFVEIKSATNVSKEKLVAFIRLTKEYGECEAVCLSNDTRPRKVAHISILPWQSGIKTLFIRKTIDPI